MIKNVIFDLGVVLLDVDYQKTILAFEKLGIQNAKQAFSKHSQDDFFRAFEKGEITDNEFLDGLSILSQEADKSSLASAWCAMLGALPEDKMQFLQKLKGKYRLFILSNTNSIHKKWFEKEIDMQYGWDTFASCFDFIGYSHELGERKPNPESYELLIRRYKLERNRTLFIDDTLEHVLGARKTAINAIHYRDGENLEKLLAPFLVL
ncbi:MAG: HAD family phosphatase [Flavobacteriales bacterium]|nr:HAD family phosphatase [Flavobacteriales bacterium]